MNGAWNVALRFTTEFDQLLQSAPPEFPSPTIGSTLEGFSPAGEGSSQLSFPFPANETWGFLGPHPAEGATTRDALDFYPYYDNAQNAPVLAMRGGVVYRPCDNMILIDHGDGWTTGYYHVIDVAVQNGRSCSAASNWAAPPPSMSAADLQRPPRSYLDRVPRSVGRNRRPRHRRLDG